MKTNMNLWCGTGEFSCVTSTIKKILALFLVLGFALSTQNAFAAHPGAPSDNGVQPMSVDGNPTCSELSTGIEGLMEFRINDPGEGMFGDGDIMVDIDIQPDKTFDWTVSGGVIIQSIFVKGGPGGNLYEYYSDGGAITTSDGGLHSPVNHKNGNYYGLSHISFCYTPGLPEITLVKDCTFGEVVGGDALRYNYELTVTNTGTLPLWDVKVVDTTAEGIDGAGSHTTNVGYLDVDGSQIITGSFVVSQNGILNHAMATGATEPGGPVATEDMASWECPEQNLLGSLSLEKDCDVVVVLNGYGDYGLQVNYSGEVCNTSEITINDVFVQDNKDPNPHFIGTLTPMGTPGACADYAGSYVPVPGEGELGEGTPGFYVGAFTDMVTATGVPVFGDLSPVMPAEAECTLCPQCVDMEMCPTPASAINLE
ncbi:DUF7507 domain-containing protein [Pseudoalteromonas sp. T1lg75]|uniref:DUF7507 domain-containing protein n=1 Tax=Pseudoalteromonas sp. T1lg75 TaxID=2077102 RepID=UPI000CF74F2F|nr:hypothetical protein [Pseudoalteromonas sp. T1lg75]